MSEILLSFCTPVMNRLADLQSTLRRNLDDNRAQQRRVEFIVMCFDRGMETMDWIQRKFTDDLATGYLRFYQSDRLQNWHFGQAKNAFRGLARGRIYASLDGDNFTGPGGGQHIIDVFEANDYDCIFHQFQGDWGDGTCGRLSLTMQDYEAIGYDEDLLPRQWDELDAILSILVQHPSRRYVCYQGKSIAKKSQPFARFLGENDVNIRTIEVDSEFDPLVYLNSGVAVGQHRSSYVQDDERLKYSSIFNHLSSFFKNARSDDLRKQYVGELVEVQRTMTERLDLPILLDWFLASQRTDFPELRPDDVPLVACIRNEVHLDDWLDHYRRLGVTHFLLVDDGSSVPISERIVAGDVWVWRPKCGKFRYSKAFWLELLLRRYACGCWVCTLDSDEYLELPDTSSLEESISNPGSTAFWKLAKWAHSQDIRYFAGFLLDMVPGPESWPSIQSKQQLKHKVFNRYQFRPTDARAAYRQHNTVKWSYGEYADWAYRIDIRFRLNRAFDSLRKFPIFLMDYDIHLNQGFHDLIISGEKRTANEMFRSDLLVIRHYKLLSIQKDAVSNEARPADAYHHETCVNLKRLRENFGTVLRMVAMSPFTFPFLGHSLIPVPVSCQITIKLQNSKASAPINFGSLITRTADIPVRIKNCATRLRDGVIEARTMENAIGWLKVTTPFRSTVDRGAEHATLKAGGNLNDEAQLTVREYTQRAQEETQ